MENERPKFVPASVQSDIADLTAADEGLTRHRKRVSFRAKQVRKEILSGIDVAELMDRYGLSERGLKKFLKGVLEQGVVTKEELDRWQSAQEPGPPDVPTTPEASATTSQILRGLRSGMSKLELMDKHGLTSEQLESVVNEAVAKGVLHCSELDTCTEKLKTAEFRSLFIDQVPTPSQSGEPAEIEIPADIPPIGRPGSTTTIKQIKTSEGIGLLIESLGHTDKREAAREKLMAFGDQAVEPLLAAIHHDDAEIRSRVPLLLADLGAAQAVEPIIALLNDPDAEVRESALMALDTLKDTRSLDPMLQALTHDSEPHNRRLAAINLGHLKDSRTIPALLEALRTEGEDWARAGAAIGLGYYAVMVHRDPPGGGGFWDFPVPCRLCTRAISRRFLFAY